MYVDVEEESNFNYDFSGYAVMFVLAGSNLFSESLSFFEVMKGFEVLSWKRVV